MASTPEEFSPNEQPAAGKVADDGERVVISGVSGLFGGARNVAELADILYNKKNPISADQNRWNFVHPEVSKYLGTIPDLQLFDAQFFKVHYRLASSMDPMGRKLLEQSYQAIYDAGINPEDLSGKKVAVFTGSCFSETEKSYLYGESTYRGFSVAGCNKAMFSNRISYSLNLKGPSHAIDQACCSSTAVVERAFQAISRGECEAAIVGGAHLVLHPQSFIHCSRVMRLSKDGTTKSFDENAAGCARSEAVNVLFLQKAKDARRIYAEIVYVKTEFSGMPKDDLGPKYGFYRDPLITTDFLKRFYDEAQIPTQSVEYVEAFGSATPEADKQELEAISNVFCKDRNEPLLIGSVLSNLGYSEAATGINSIIKVLLGYQRGELAANLHCTSPRRDVAALRDGRMRIVTEHARCRRSYVAVNGLSVTGVNSHVLLHGHYKPKNLSLYKSNIPYLVTLSGRQESSVRIILNELKSCPIDPEQIALFHNIHKSPTAGHLGRGFIILDKNEENKTVSLTEKADYFDDLKRPLWFVYSGMGSQWAGMGEHLMRIPVFAAAIERCRRILEPKGIDIVHIITSRDKTIFDNILNSFVGIAAIQIGLTDILREMDLVPDKIIGHSVGELGCAYADGCFTAEEMILSAYSRGLVSVQTPFIRGSMAAVGIGYEQISSMCPPEIEVACHNGPDSCTISGPADVMREFVSQLTAQNIFAKEVPCSNIAYHSRYIAEAGPGLLKYLSEVIKCPKPRSERWVSTSVPMDKWGEESAKYSSAEYHTNNLLRPVLFEESSRLVPANAVLVEVAPHGLLQAILKRSLPDSCCHVPLTRRGHPDNARMVLEAIGQLFMVGYCPRVEALYPKIEFPVSTETPMLSHLIEWAHHEEWSLPFYLSASKKKAAAINLILSTHDEENRYLEGNIIKGKNLYPFAASLVAVWDTLAMTRGVARRQLAVQFRQVELHAQPLLHERPLLRLDVSLHRGTGRFEVMDDMNSQLVTGFIKTEIDHHFSQEEIGNRYLDVTSKEIYNNFILRDFCYRDCFQSVHSVNSNISEARIIWRDNWVTFLDGMIQFNLLRHSLQSHSRPASIGKMIIDPEAHSKNEDTIKKATIQDNLTRCGGVLIENIKFHDLPVSDNTRPLRVLKFVPHFSTGQFDFAPVLQTYMQIITENMNKDKINILGIYEDKSAVSKLEKIKNILDEVSEVTTQYKWLHRDCLVQGVDNDVTNTNVIVVFNMATDKHMYQVLSEVLQDNTFIMNIENTTKNLDKVSYPGESNEVICGHNVDSEYLELSYWRSPRTAEVNSVVIVNSSFDFPLISDKQDALLPNQNLLILTSYPAPEGLKEYLNHCKNKYGCNFRLVMSNNGKYGELDAGSLINMNLAVRVFKDDISGGDYFVPLQDISNVYKNVTLRSSVIGQLESLRWQEAPLKKERGILIKVHYAGLNDLDAKRAAGILPLDNADSDKGYGMDFSGVTESGMRVMGLVAGGAASTCVEACPELLWPVPEHWSLEDAATVPLAYCLAYYCLTIKFPLYRGASILVHGGAGALGQAAIAIALALQCQVFVTVSDVRKKKFLLNMFPALKAENIGNSRDLSFYDMVLSGTNGKGVSFCICNVKEELKTASIKCVGYLGLTIDVTQIPNKEQFDFGMELLQKERCYFPINFSSIFNESGKTTMKWLQRMVGEGIARGWVRPLSRAVYGAQDAARALRLLAAANQRGRALLRLRTAAGHLDTPCALPRVRCSSDQCHIVISDHEYVGQHLVDKLVGSGVRKLSFYTPMLPHDLKFKIRQWQGVGAQVSCETLCNLNDILKSFIGSRSLEPIEGIYIVITNKSTPVLESASFVEKMDMLSRKLVPNIKYFAVINTANSIGAETCTSRVANRFSGTMIRLPEIRQVNAEHLGDGEGMTAYEAAAAAERALCAAAPVLSAAGSRQPRLSLLQQLARVAGITITQNVSGTETLLDLCMDPRRLNNVCVFLRDTHNVFLSLAEVQNLTVQRIKDIDETLTVKEFDDEKGLKTFFSYVDPDELRATAELVIMPTLSSGSGTISDEFDVNETYLCIVPGVEGHHLRFSALCERLKLPALVLQPGLNWPRETLRQTADRYAKILLEKAGLKTNFYLLGYESGVLVALELAAILEDHGLAGTVFCLGAPPAEFDEELREHLRGLETEEELQDAVLRHMFTLMTGSTEGEGGEGELRGVLQKGAAWGDKVEAAVRLLLGRVPHSAQYARQLMEVARGRLEVLRRGAGAARALRSRLVLLRPAPAPASAAALQPHSLQPVHAHSLRAPLAHAPQDLRCAAIINSYLDDTVLQAFQNKNLCKSYVLNTERFTS